MEINYIIENILACPVCNSKLKLRGDELACQLSNPHVFKTNSRGFYEFGEKANADKYDDELYVESYFGDAYGFQAVNISREKGRFVGVGQPEGLYRTAVQLALQCLIESKSCEKEIFHVLDVACGLGRRVRDVAELFPNAFVIGLDYSSQMIRYARDVIVQENPFTIDLGSSGFGQIRVNGHGLHNVFLAQADARYLPINMTHPRDSFQGFDLVFNCMLIDRIQAPADIEKAIQQTILAMAPGGYLVFCCPFNWITSNAWDYFGDARYFVLDVFEKNGLKLLDVFDGLVYRELLDLHGTHMELPVLFARCKKQ